VTPVGNTSSFSILKTVLSFAFDVFAVAVTFRHVFSKERAGLETISGALRVYLLAGFSFASVHNVLATFQSDAFYLEPLTNYTPFPTGSTSSFTVLAR
jgi:hypothetical protein